MDAHDNEQYAATVAGCETAARSRGHALGAWYPVDERLHAALCEVCGAMVWVSLSGGEERWRRGGAALEQDCLEEGERSETGA